MRVPVRPLVGGLVASAFVASIGQPIPSAAAGQGQAAAALRSSERIKVNDNRTPAGTFANGTLAVRLEARLGEWRPDGDGKPPVVVKAFSADGGPLQVPSPLIRVKPGTTLRVSVRNATDEPLVVHGLYSRPGSEADAAKPLTVGPGQTQEVSFLAGAPGIYYYWAASDVKDRVAQRRLGRDSQLSGALVVDPEGVVPHDRVMVIGTWTNDDPIQPGAPGSVFRMVINGRSWPHTERLTYAVGDTVRMQLANVGADVHPMHLHGFYFNVDSRGDERQHVILPATSPRLVVTERLAAGQTYSLTWKPTRPGNWLFHCHDNAHLIPGQPFDGGPVPAPVGHDHSGDMDKMMEGPVVGITVTGRSAERVVSAGARRRLRLVARVDAGGTMAEPAYGYTLHDGASVQAPSGPYLPGPTILLRKHQPVTITVDNRLPDATSVHWHGIELESYYDGVSGFAGEGKQLAPAIAPGKTFDARFTPPRSGTFIYHTHLDDVRQQRAGLSGALLVVDNPATYDPAHDWVMLVSVPRKSADNSKVLLNGTLAPEMREMQAGQRYRLRFINVHTSRPSMRMRLLRGETLLRWRIVAKDGMDLPADQLRESTSDIQMGNGETYDVEFVPDAVGDIRVDVTAGNLVLLNSMPIRVRQP